MTVPALFHISVMNSLTDLSLWHVFSTLCGLFRFCVWRLSGWTKKTFYQHFVTAYKVNRATTAAFETVLSNWNKLKHRCMSMLICICHLFTCNSWLGIEFFAFEFLLQKLINGLISHPILVSSSDYCLLQLASDQHTLFHVHMAVLVTEALIFLVSVWNGPCNRTLATNSSNDF